MEPARNSPNKKLKLCREEEDMISNFPEAVLHHILSFLDLNRAVQTSVLSTKWRYLWTSLPFLNFNCNLFKSRKAGKANAKAFKEFVDHVLILRDSSSNLQRFNLYCYNLDKSDDISSTHLHTWILTALKQNLQELYLQISVVYGEFRLPRCLFTCKSLTILELKLSSGSPFPLKLNLPDSMSLPRLKTLRLHSVQLEGDDVLTKIFSSCPVLEWLTIMDCVFRQSNLDITALKLKHLVIKNLYYNFSIKLYAPNLISFCCDDSMCNDYSIENLSALVKAELCLIFNKCDKTGVRTPDNETVKVYAQRMRKFLGALRNMEALTLSGVFLEVVLRDLALLASTPDQFHNLRFLKLETVLCRISMKTICTLLMISPNIETLHLEIKKGIYKIVPTDYFFQYWDELKLIHQEKIEAYLKVSLVKDFLYQLKFVEIRGVEGRVNELIILDFLLKHAICLEKMVVFTSKEDSPHRERRLIKFTEKLLNSPRASPSIAILFF